MKTQNSLDTYKTAQAAIESIDLLLEEIGANCKASHRMANWPDITEAERKTYKRLCDFHSNKAKKINQARWDIIEALKTFEA